jgi:hypothetical protein
VTLELMNLNWSALMPFDLDSCTVPMPNRTCPGLRITSRSECPRVPSNPGEQYKNWPWWRGQEKRG